MLSPRNSLNDTIVAVATPPGRGGVGIVRLSGPNALPIAQHLSLKTDLKPRHATYAAFYDQQKQMLDDGIIVYFKAPHSFTGEEVVELQCHGSPIVLDSLIKQCLLLGARLAKPGEFSERAFLNDKMDLAQAEAVADLINASSQTAARMAVKSLQGAFSKQINQLNEQIIHLRLYIEATLDFPDEEIDLLADGKVASMQNTILTQIQAIRGQASQGVLLREGLSVVIAGPPNAGKSTLINQLAAREVAIVTDIPGTTRDVMREHILIDDLPIHIIDTAGLRESQDAVEKEGIRRAVDEIKRADCILWVTDIEHMKQQHSAKSQLKSLGMPVDLLEAPIIEVINKIDTVGSQSGDRDNHIYLSALTGVGVDCLKAKIKALVGYHPNDGIFLARRRHLDALDLALEHLLLAKQHMTTSGASELIAEELRLAHQCLAEITGEFTPDDLLGRIFSTFCIGK